MEGAMSRALQKANGQYHAGQYKKAVATLVEVSFAGDDGEAEARGVLALATLLRDATEGRVRADCEEQIARAERLLGGAQQASAKQHLDRREAELRGDPVALARWAREVGLTWLQMTSAEDLVAARMRSVMASESGSAGGAASCVLEAVEAEGWRLEHVACLFRPTRVETSPLRGADLFMGGDVIGGEEHYLYYFRRVDGASG
jgi:hypothetical protein